jgi:hypothetical protein
MEKVCGLDVHKDSVFACILDEQGKRILEKRYGTLTPDLTAEGHSGVINTTDIEMLKGCMEQIDLLEKQRAACLNHLEELADAYFAREISLLCTIPDIQKYSAMCILSEIGNDMSVFVKLPIWWVGRDCVRETMNRPARYSHVRPCTETNTLERYLFNVSST